jgi:hypothetical protein
MAEVRLASKPGKSFTGRKGEEELSGYVKIPPPSLLLSL